MFIKGFFTNSGGILCSRITGFFRDLTMSGILGASIYSDLFLIAFKIPNLFRRIFAEGAFSQAFLPSLSNARYKGALCVNVGFNLLLFIITLSLLITLFAPYVAKILAVGLNDEENEIVSTLLTINFWYLPLIFIVTLFGSMLQYKNNFLAAAYSTMFLNLAMIISLLLSIQQSALDIVIWLSYATLIGGLIQIIIHIYPLKKLGFCRLLYVGFFFLKGKKEQLKKDTRKFYSQFFPAILGGSTVQIASLIDIQLASFLNTGSISYLYYANRIFQLPLALFAIATSIALYPVVLKAIKNNNITEALKQLKSAFWFLFIILLLCSVGGIVLSQEIIWILFERGNFSHTDTMQTGIILAMYLIGLLPFGLAKIFSLWLYSHHQQMLAAQISIKSLLVGTVCSLILMWKYEAVGLALAGSLSGVALLYWSIKAFGFYRFWAIIADKKHWLILMSCIIAEVPILIGIKWGIEKLYMNLS